MTSTVDSLLSVAARAKQRYPDHRIETEPFSVCWPVYEVRLMLIYLAEHELTTTARFLLRLLDGEPLLPEAIGALLGLTEDYVAGAAAELLHANLIVQLGDTRIQITDLGRQLLSDGGRYSRPRRQSYKVPYDPLVRGIADMGIGQLTNGNSVREEGNFVLPGRPREPRLAAVRLDDVRAYMVAEGGSWADREIVEVAQVRSARLRYRTDLVVMKLEAPQSSSSTYAVYRGLQFMEAESAALQRLADEGVDVVPQELAPEVSRPWAGMPDLGHRESELFESINEAGNHLAEAHRETAIAEQLLSSSDDQGDHSELYVGVAKLSETVDMLAAGIDEMRRELADITDDQTKLLVTEDHRNVLLQAVDSAMSDLTLVSAWIKPSAFDGGLRRRLVDAMRRGVTVRIGWGLGSDNPSSRDYQRNVGVGIKLVNKFRSEIPTSLRHKFVEKRTETHEKFIICDDLFVAFGSFNWLSYRGEPGRGYRRESSIHSQRRIDLERWTARAQEMFPDLQ